MGVNEVAIFILTYGIFKVGFRRKSISMNILNSATYYD